MEDGEPGEVRDTGGSGSQPAQQCASCAHFIGKSESGGRTGRCLAFEEIPVELWSGRVSHAVPYPGDHGVLFKSWK